MSLVVIPITISEANVAISAWHRHHQPTVGGRFALGAIGDDGTLHGVCVVGRPVARLAGHPRDVAEVTRLATDGTRNACSILYGAAARACKAMGFLRIQTYILDSETGASLRGAGWVCDGAAGGGSWVRVNRERRIDQPMGAKRRWSLTLSSERTNVVLFPDANHDQAQLVIA